jgi:hypothetical protein
MREGFHVITGQEEPKWSFQEARAMGEKVRSMADLHPGIARELLDAAGMIEHLAHCTDVYRFRWVNAEKSAHALRNPPLDAEKARNDEDK